MHVPRLRKSTIARWPLSTCGPIAASFSAAPEGIDDLYSAGCSQAGDVSLPVQYAPDIHVVFAFNVRDKLGKPLQRPEPQVRHIEFDGVTR